ncbi:MAG TPA: hypothetical protein VFY40_03430 [Blastocatellia bacterium]|nr:hypothetical protein [Blastocatellia bacterium]
MPPLPPLQAGFDSQEVEIASAVFPEEWGYVSGERHDLAVVDVGPALLEPLLGNLRGSKEHSKIPVLVERSRVAAAPVAGVLPKNRAMPCSRDFASVIRLRIRRIRRLRLIIPSSRPSRRRNLGDVLFIHQPQRGFNLRVGRDRIDLTRPPHRQGADVRLHSSRGTESVSLSVMIPRSASLSPTT